MLPGVQPRLFLLPMAMLLVATGASAAPSRPRPIRLATHDDALAAATSDWRELSADRRRRTQRQVWLRVVAGLEKVGRASGGPTASLALLRAGRAAEALWMLSHRSADAERADRLYQDSAAASPTGSLADDALLDAARLERDALRDETRARRTLDRAAALRGDRHSDAVKLLAQLPPERGQKAVKAAKEVAARQDRVRRLSPSPRALAEAEQELAQATLELRRLQAMPSRKQRREAWTKTIARLEAAGTALAPDPHGALAFLRAGRAAQSLANLSNRSDDARRAVNLYLAGVEKCPGSSLADDALVAAAALETKALSDPGASRRHLEQAIALGGDCTALARGQARGLDDIRAKDAPAPVEAKAQDVAARAEVEDVVTDWPPPPALEPAPAPTAPVPATAAVAAGVRELQKKALADTEWSLAEQVGLKIRRIIVDAGHGGHDTGAIGPTGVYEKDVTLGVARELAALLRNRGYEVVLTRDSDVFLALEERTQLANREAGDLFISVHANAHKSRQQSGVETYSLNVASDRYAMRLAARENATTERPGSDLQFLLADLATRANTVDSARLAQEVQHSVVQGVARKFGKPKDHGVKHALFYVLLGARMPAVLVETAFLSNPGEEKKLASGAYQTALGKAIADGIDRFVSRRHQLASLEK